MGNGIPTRASSTATTTLGSPHHYRPLETLHDAHATVDGFREKCFNPQRPGILPRGHFRHATAIPALERWFLPLKDNKSNPDEMSASSRLNIEYLQRHGADAFVPLEYTKLTTPSSPNRGDTQFQRFQAPLSLFLEWMKQSQSQSQSESNANNTNSTPTRLYLAQCQLLDLPQPLRDDFPPPPLVLQTGRGDIYDTNIWIGLPPTYTPLHRDPNPNLFVQLAGRKVVRLLSPGDGLALFGFVRRLLGRGGGWEEAVFRGEEMMRGEERGVLEEVVWGDFLGGGGGGGSGEGFETSLGPGDGLFIPNGWWHSIKGVGEGVTGSVSGLFARIYRSSANWHRSIGGFDELSILITSTYKLIQHIIASSHHHQ